MAASWKVRRNLVTAGTNATRILWHIYYFFTNWLPSNFPGHYSVVEAYPGAAGNWTSETGPTSGAFLVVESAYAWGGVKHQIMFGATNAALAIGGYAGPYTGLVAGLAPDGGWDTGTKTFGAALFTGLLYARGAGSGNNAATVFHLAVVEHALNGVVDNSAFLLLGDESISGSWDTSFYAGAMYDFEPSLVTKPAVFFCGYPKWDDVAGHWGRGAVPQGRVPNAAWLGFNNAVMDNGLSMDGYMLTKAASEPAGYPILIQDRSINKVVGWLCEVYRTDAAVADGTANTAGNRIVYNGLMFPW